MKYVKIMLGIFVALLLVVLVGGGPQPAPDISVGIIAQSNGVNTGFAVMRLVNAGSVTVRVDPHCTLYWTNRLGLSTNGFYRFQRNYALLTPGQSNDFRISVPPEANVWRLSITYQAKPNALTRMVNEVKWQLSGAWHPDNSFIGRFSPFVTNAVNEVNSTREPMP